MEFCSCKTMFVRVHVQGKGYKLLLKQCKLVDVCLEHYKPQPIYLDTKR